jgi:hypothetical protein
MTKYKAARHKDRQLLFTIEGATGWDWFDI